MAVPEMIYQDPIDHTRVLDPGQNITMARYLGVSVSIAVRK